MGLLEGRQQRGVGAWRLALGVPPGGLCQAGRTEGWRGGEVGADHRSTALLSLALNRISIQICEAEDGRLKL